MKLRAIVLLLSIILTSCLGTKYLKNDEYLLYKQKIKSSSRFSQEDLHDQLVQTPNTKLPLLPINHLIYFRKLGETAYDTTALERKLKKVERQYDKKIKRTPSGRKRAQLNTKKLNKAEKIKLKLEDGNQLMRWGEKIVVFDSITADESIQNLKNYLFNQGYFNTEITLSVKYVKQKALVTYEIDEKKHYRIDSLIYNIPDTTVRKLFREHLDGHTFLHKRYDQDLISKERDRVFNLLSDNGYFNFKRQYILFDVDSTLLGNHQLVVRETIANPPGKTRHQIYRIDSISMTTESNTALTAHPELVIYNGVTFQFNKSEYPERLLGWRIFIQKDSLYSKSLTLQTQKQLSYLDMFKFVNINYDTTGGQFNANIFTSPLKKFQTSTEMGLSMLDQAQGLPGPFFNFNAKSRNVFGGLEIIQLDGNASIQGIKSVSDENRNYSRLQYGGDLSITFPQFLFPLKEAKRSAISRYNPKTKFSTGINFEDRRDEYRRTTIDGSYSYLWQVKDFSQFTFIPLEVASIKSDNTTSFEETLSELSSKGYQSLVNAFRSSFVSFTSVQANYNINNYGIGNSDATYLQTSWEIGGTLQELLGGQPFGTDLTYYQYAKANIDVRRNHRLTNKSALAYRLNLGVAYTYGNNLALPYEKYYFAGGSNSIRAWQPRRLGPGSFATYDTTSTSSDTKVNYTYERAGDIIMESSLEYRSTLIGFVDYALFVDAGNIWLWKSNTVDPSEDPQHDDGVFRLKTFPREIAVGAGFGFRFDFSFLVLRLDLAYKVIDPAFPLGQRFVLRNFKVTDLWDLQNAGALNIGIGYPF